MGASIGIDLGTTNSVCAFTRNGSNPSALTNRERHNLTPSVVGRHRDGTLLVGAHAVKAARLDPVNTVFSVKRLMGRRYGDDEVAKVQQHVSYRIVGSENGSNTANVLIGEKQYTPVDVSALILEKIKKDAEEALGETVTHAVITVPAYFDDNQRAATRSAGLQAGLQVKRIIDEPTAAAYAFGMDMEAGTAKAVVVYDLGGGTFDISIIFISEGIPTVENISGDIWLGGDRFDSYIMDHVIRKFPEHEKELRANPKFMWELRSQAEEVKKNLGGMPSSDVVITDALGKFDVEVNISRQEFESFIISDIDKSVELVDKALKEATLSREEIDNVLLVGGSTALPLVRRKLAQKFGEEKLRANINPMECVALGAAILASKTEKKFCPRKACQRENEPDAIKCQNPECGEDLGQVQARVKCPHCSELHDQNAVKCEKTGKSLVVVERPPTAKPYGIEVQGGRFEIVVPKGTRYPTTDPVVREFRTSGAFIDRIVIPVYQGFDTAVKNNEQQAVILIPEDGPIPDQKRVDKDTPFDIGFEIDENGLLTIQVTGKGPLSWLRVGKVVRPYENGGGEIPATVPPTVMCSRCQQQNPKGSKACQNCGESLTGGSGGGPERAAWESELSYLITLAASAVHDFDWALPAAAIQELQAAIDRARGPLERKDEAAGRLAIDDLNNLLNKHCGGMDDLLVANAVANRRLGDLAQSQKLGAMLEDYKRKVLGGESPRTPEMQQRRDAITNLTQEILGSLDNADKVVCENPKCGKMRKRPTPRNGECEFCGFNPFLPKS